MHDDAFELARNDYVYPSEELKSDEFTLILSVSCRSVMNSARELVFAQFTRKSGIVWRITLPTTNSDGGMPGRMVLSQEPNESQTSLGNTTERYCSRPCAMAPACMKT